MKFFQNLKNLLNSITSSHKTRPHGWQTRRLTRFEILESRELLSVNVLGPVTGYAQPNTPAEIQFDLTTNKNTVTQFDFTVQRSSGSTLDPSQLRLFNRSTGQLMGLSNIVNGTSTSNASAMLTTGSYSIFVSADGGAGNFTFVISEENPIKSGLDILVLAAIAQRSNPSSWANRVAYYNDLLANTSYAGAASAMPIAKAYPEVDANGDGKIDLTDNVTAQQKANTPSVTVNSYSVAQVDPVPFTFQDSGNGNVTVPSNHHVQSVDGQFLQSGQSKILSNGLGTVTLQTNGSLTFVAGANMTKLAQGETETVNIPVVTQDVYGNEYSFTATFTVTGQNELPVLSNSEPLSLTFNQTAGSGTIKTSTILACWSDPDRKTKLSVVNPVIQSVSSSNNVHLSKYTPATLQQYLSLNTSGNNSGVTFNVSDSFFDDLGLNETLTITVSYGVTDEYGQSPNTGTLRITANGKDNPSVLTANQTAFSIISNDINNPVKTIAAEFSVTDPDKKDATGFIYSFSNVRDGSVSANNGLITGFNTTTGTFNIDTSKLQNRSIKSVVTLDVTVKSISGGIVSKTLTINLNPVAVPTATNLVLRTTETEQLTGIKVTPTIAEKGGFTTSGLTLVNADGFDTLPQNVALETVATLDKNGNFVFTPDKNFEYLKQTENLKLKFQYTITDTQYGLTGLGTIELTITGTVTAPTGQPNQIIGTDGKYSATESNGTVEKIVVSKSDILENWTLPDGLDAYSIVLDNTNPVSFEKWSGGTEKPLDSDSFGSVNIIAGNLVFWSNSSNYKKLGVGQWLDVAVPVSVRDAIGSISPVGKVLIRIKGENNAPEIKCDQDRFIFVANSTEDVLFKPGFTINDPDLNDKGSKPQYSIDSTSTKNGFKIDNSGNILISNEEKYKLDEGNYTITVTVKDNNGGTTTKDISVQVFRESKPVLSNTPVSENERDLSVIELDINKRITQKIGHLYSISMSQLPQILLNGE
ncbi:MAG: hypothetical protein LBP87_01290, partial [Planctomycetaceae bacterium]|nr:hypothetical protein [Planctomycetaceae bacterium]